MYIYIYIYYGGALNTYFLFSGLYGAEKVPISEKKNHVKIVAVKRLISTGGGGGGGGESVFMHV